MQRDSAAQKAALATVRHFNAVLSAKGYAWAWPKIAAALVSKHHWLIINCDACGTVVDLHLRMKPRDPEASVRVALGGFQCPRCNGHGQPRIIGLAQHPTKLCACPLSRSLLGVKRTCPFALHMSAFDPKRTSCHGVKAGICLGLSIVVNPP